MGSNRSASAAHDLIYWKHLFAATWARCVARIRHAFGYRDCERLAIDGSANYGPYNTTYICVAMLSLPVYDRQQQRFLRYVNALS